MKHSLYSVSDTASGIFAAPFLSHNNQTAIRSLDQARKDPNTTIHHSPADFDLHRIGEFDDTTGVLTEFTAPLYVINVANIESREPFTSNQK